jgi:hypothetical protein
MNEAQGDQVIKLLQDIAVTLDNISNDVGTILINQN